MNRPHVSFRCFTPQDLPEILRIQEANLLGNLSPADQADGFLSVAFPARQFEAMHHQVPIVVADLGSRLGGYLCGSSLESSRTVPLLAHMIARFDATRFENRSLDAYRSFVYGPVCIDRPHRGSGLLKGLFDELMRRLKGRYDVGTLFIACSNPRSLRAHTHHLGMKPLSRFTFGENEYHLLAFDVPAD